MPRRRPARALVGKQVLGLVELAVAGGVDLVTLGGGKGVDLFGLGRGDGGDLLRLGKALRRLHLGIGGRR